MSNLRWKLVAVVAVLVVFATVGVYPIVANRYGLPMPGWLAAKALKLGLDLKGGVHLVLRVQTDDALRVATEQESERFRERLTTAGIAVDNITVPSPTEFKIEGVKPDQEGAFRQSANEVSADFDRSAGVGGTYTFTMRPSVQATLRDEAVVQARQTIERRVDALGVAEPIIAQQGSEGNQILVQLPGMSDVNRAKEVIYTTGRLDLKLVERTASTKEELTPGGVVPSGMEVLSGAASGGGGQMFYLIRRAAIVSGTDLRGARPSVDENNQPAVGFTLKSDAGRRFGEATQANIGRQLAIVLDGRVESAPTIESRISTEGRITGSFTQQEAQDLALILRSGALTARMDYLQQLTVGPTLGADSIRAGVIASLAGLVLIVLFMLWYYRLSGVNAVIALTFNLIILLGLMAYVGAAMTLPGIAGFILTIGIGVDSNVLIFERIKEELDAGRGVRQAINAGFSRVFLTLVDTHIAGFIAAAFLFQFGTGAIRGFAVTLSVGLVSNLFTSTFVSKALFELILSRRRQVATLSI
jgi:preprotein translocase subunit SecD